MPNIVRSPEEHVRRYCCPSSFRKRGDASLRTRIGAGAYSDSPRMTKAIAVDSCLLPLRSCSPSLCELLPAFSRSPGAFLPAGSPSTGQGKSSVGSLHLREKEAVRTTSMMSSSPHFHGANACACSLRARAGEMNRSRAAGVYSADLRNVQVPHRGGHPPHRFPPVVHAHYWTSGDRETRTQHQIRYLQGREMSKKPGGDLGTYPCPLNRFRRRVAALMWCTRSLEHLRAHFARS